MREVDLTSKWPSHASHLQCSQSLLQPGKLLEEKVLQAALVTLLYTCSSASSLLFNCSLAYKPVCFCGVAERAGCSPCGALRVVYQAHQPCMWCARRSGHVKRVCQIHALIVAESDQSMPPWHAPLPELCLWLSCFLASYIEAESWLLGHMQSNNERRTSRTGGRLCATHSRRFQGR